MNATYEKIGNDKVRIQFSASPEAFDKAIEKSYQKNKKRVNLPGFRKGKIPRQILEAQAGGAYLYPDAIDFVFPETYEEVLTELDITPVSQPEVDVNEVSKQDGVDFTVEVYIEPDITVTDYKGLSYEPMDVTVSDEDIENEIQKVCDQNSRLAPITDRPSQNGDSLVIDYKGSIDNVPFEGGEAEDHEIVLGSKSFIDNFEEQLEGHYVNDEFTVSVNFPEEYHAEELSGKPAEFVVKVKEIREKIYPIVDDEFAQDVSEFDTLDEYKADIREKLSKDKEHQADHFKQDTIYGKLLENSTVEIPDVMIENETKNSIEAMANNLRSSGLTFETYLQYMGKTEEDYKEAVRPDVINQIKLRLALTKVAELENLEVTEDDINAEINKMAEQYKMQPEYIRSFFDSDSKKRSLIKDIKVMKATEVVMNSAVEDK